MDGIQQVLAEALELGERGEWDEAARMLAESLEDNPDDPALLCWLGVAERELGNEGSAYEFFRRCVAEEPTDPQILALAGSGLAAFDDPEAESVLRMAALTGPEIPSTRLQYGAYLSREGLFEPALEQLQAAQQLDPEDPVIPGELGVAYALKGDMRAAADALETALEMAPDDSWTRVILGLVNLELGEDEAAAEALLQAAQEQPEDAEAQILAALAAAAVGWEDAAQDAIARAEYAATEGDRAMWEEAEDRIGTGPDAARALLRDTLAPPALRGRLAQPL